MPADERATLREIAEQCAKNLDEHRGAIGDHCTGCVDRIEKALKGADRRAREDCKRLQPATAEDPNESSYQRGYFDGVMAYAAAIRASITTDEG